MRKPWRCISNYTNACVGGNNHQIKNKIGVFTIQQMQAWLFKHSCGFVWGRARCADRHYDNSDRLLCEEHPIGAPASAVNPGGCVWVGGGAKDVNRNCTGVDGQVTLMLISQLQLANSSVTGDGAGCNTNVYLAQDLFSDCAQNV